MKHFYSFQRGVLLGGILLGTLCIPSFGQTEQNLGSASALKSKLYDLNQVKSIRKSKKSFQMKVSGAASDVVISKVVEDELFTTFHGYVRQNQDAKVVLTFEGDEASGFIIDDQKETATTFKTLNGQVISKEENIHQVICADYGYVEYTEKNNPSLRPLDDSRPVNDLSSLPGAPATIYLDFDGEIVENTSWNNGNRIVAASPNYSDQKIRSIWKEVSEDFMPFNVNVTTNLSTFNNTPRNRRMQTIFTPSQAWRGRSSGGVAYIGSFNSNTNDPCWVFNDGTRSAAVTASHEVGHTLELYHDGLRAVNGSPALGYYNGQADWGTIMGGVQTRAVTQWSKGEYNNADNFEDDLAIITATGNGFGYKTDDHSNSRTNATDMIVEPNGSVLASKNHGVIERSSDKDFFKFVTGAGQITMNIRPAGYIPNLNIQARILNSNGGQVAVSNPGNLLAASFTTTLVAGTYFLEVDGVGNANPATNGYSDYASLGFYDVSAQLIANVATDCNNVPGGSAFTDDCNVCVGGNTGRFPCADLANGTYTIQALHSNKCLYPATVVEQTTCNESAANQVWTIQKRGNFYSLVNFGNGNALALPNTDNLTRTNANSVFSNLNTQLFRFEQESPTNIKMVPRNNQAKAIAIAGSSQNNGADLVVWNLINDNNYKFIFTPVNVTKDCNNTINGTAFVDFCDACVGGNTNQEPCQVPYVSHTIPGTIELENFDDGGQNISFFDSSDDNKGNVYRINLPVDIAGIGTDNYCLGWTANGEWTEYTVDITQDGMYDLEYTLSSPNSGGMFNVALDNVDITGNIAVTNSGGWGAFTTRKMADPISLNRGQKVLRFNIESGGFNADRLIFTRRVVSGVNGQINNSLQIFPNPSSSGLFQISKDTQWTAYDLLGSPIKNGETKTVDLSDQNKGIYLIKFNGLTERIVIQ